MLQRVSSILHTLLFLVLIGTCASTIYYLNKEPSATPSAVFTLTSAYTLTPAFTSTPVPSLSPTLESAPDRDWSLLQPGLERRLIKIYNDQNQHIESVYIWRLDQNYFRLDVAFDERPKSLETWQKETNAALVVNGGFFSIQNERYSANGLTVIDGKTFGSSYHGFGGMLAINNQRAELRWLVDEPYDPDESFQAALQSFPILVIPGGQLGFGAERENYARARRTVIGQDRDGRILFLVTPRGHFTLHELSVYLTESDLNLDIAVNLDGGGSTGILVANPQEIIPSNVLLPFVILVYARY